MTRYLLPTLLLATPAPIRAKRAGPVKIGFAGTAKTGRGVSAETLAKAAAN